MEIKQYLCNPPEFWSLASIDLCYKEFDRVRVEIPNTEHFVNIIEALSDSKLWLNKETIEKIACDYWDNYKNLFKW